MREPQKLLKVHCNSKNGTQKPKNIALLVSNHLCMNTGTPIHFLQNHLKNLYAFRDLEAFMNCISKVLSLP